MNAEQQYIDLFSQTEAMICQHSTEVMNTPRATAFADFERLGFPTRKQEKYKYTDVSKFFEPDYGLNLNRLDIPAGVLGAALPGVVDLLRPRPPRWRRRWPSARFSPFGAAPSAGLGGCALARLRSAFSPAGLSPGLRAPDLRLG